MHHFRVVWGFFSCFPARGARHHWHFFLRAVFVFLGTQRIPHLQHSSLPCTRSHIFPAGMFKQETQLPKHSSFCHTLPVPATKFAPGIITHIASQPTPFNLEDARALWPRLKGKRLGHYLLFLNIETFSAGVYPRLKAGAKPNPRWREMLDTPLYSSWRGGVG